MPIDHDAEPEVDRTVVREGPGWRQTTPPPESNKGRTYLDCAPADESWPAIDDEFDSMTSALRAGFPTDFTGPTKWNQARWTWANRTDLLTKPEDEAIKAMVESSGVTLNIAADRGTGMHHYIECRLEGRDPDWEWLGTMGSLPWIAAAENFLVTEQPRLVIAETVCFDRERMVAGTVDAVVELPKRGWRYAEIDWKSREQKSRRDYTHARRPKEAAQLGGYAKMLTRGYYMNERGRRWQLDAEVLHLAIVTFGADGTYAVHEADFDHAIDAYETAMDMREKSKTSYVMPFKPDYSDEWDGHNAAVLEAIARIPVECEEMSMLQRAWKAAGLGRASQGELAPEQYGVAMHLIYAHAAAYQPFVESTSPPSPACPPQRHNDLAHRLADLPPDIYAETTHHATGLTPLAATVISTEDADDWGRLIQGAESRVAGRRVEIENIVAQSNGDLRQMYVREFGSSANWTDEQIDLAACACIAVEDGHLGPGLAPTEVSLEALAVRGKREVVREAKALAEKYGRPRPSKWDDLASDPLLYAVVVTA